MPWHEPAYLSRTLHNLATKLSLLSSSNGKKRCSSRSYTLWNSRSWPGKSMLTKKLACQSTTQPVTNVYDVYLWNYLECVLNGIDFKLCALHSITTRSNWSVVLKVKVVLVCYCRADVIMRAIIFSWVSPWEADKFFR